MEKVIKKTFDNIFEEKNNSISKKIENIEYIYIINHKNNIKINFKKSELNKNNILDKFYNSYKNYHLKKLTNKDILYIQDKSKFFSKEDTIKYLFQIFSSTEKYNICYMKESLNEKNNYNKSDNVFIRYDNKFFSEKIKNVSKQEQNLNIYKGIINILFNINNILNDNGNIIFFIRGYDGYMIELLFLLSYIFNEVIIIDGYIIICKNYIKELKNDIKKIIDNNYEFTIDLNNILEIKKIYKYFNATYNTELYFKKKYLLNKKDEEQYIKYKYLKYLIIAKQLNLDVIPEIKIELDLVYANNFRVKYNNNKVYKITSAINFTEGNYIEKIIKKYNFKNCLEIGMANGLSSIYILKNKDTKLISIDPFQTEQWKNEGLKFLKKLKLEKNHTLIQTKSYEALPELLKNGDKFDFIFIDGWHTFDYTLIDFFYSDLLLKVGGVIIIDDALHKGVSKCAKYIDTNYKFYKKLESPNSVAAYLKLKEDNREWNFHFDF